MKTYKEIHTSDLITMIKEDENGIYEKKISDKEYNNIVSWIPYMNKIGKEIIRYSYYSKYGYKIVKYIKSISPDGTKSIVYRFKV